MATCQRSSRPYAFAGEGARRGITYLRMKKRLGNRANSGSCFTHEELVIFGLLDSLYWSSRGRSLASAGSGGRISPLQYAARIRRKVSVYDLCLMVDFASEQE